MSLSGLSAIRRDAFPLQVELAKTVLHKMLVDRVSPEDMAAWVRGQLRVVWSRELEKRDLRQFAVTRSLSKPLEDYCAAKPPGHVLAARKMVARPGAEQLSGGSRFAVVITEGAMRSKVGERTEAIEVAFTDRLLLDRDYYVNALVKTLANLCSVLFTQNELNSVALQRELLPGVRQAGQTALTVPQQLHIAKMKKISRVVGETYAVKLFGDRRALEAGGKRVNKECNEEGGGGRGAGQRQEGAPCLFRLLEDEGRGTVGNWRH